MNLPDAGAGVGGGVLVAFFAWLLGRTDSAALRREKEIRAVAEAVCIEIEKEARVGIRLDRLEQSIPRLEDKIDQNNRMTSGLVDMLTDLARAAGINRRTGLERRTRD